MPQIYDMGPMALLPLWRKASWGFFRPKNPTASAGFEPANLGMLRKIGLHFLGIEKKQKTYIYSTAAELTASIVNVLAYLNLNLIQFFKKF